MKRLILLTAVLIGSFANAQEMDINDKNQTYNVWEVKTNALYLILGVAEFSVERTLSSESSIGVSAAIPFDEDIMDEIEYYISPYYRLFFGDKYASGFFVEGFGMLNSTERIVLETGNDDEFVTDFALGIGLGGKWVTKKGFLAELHFGVGRNLFNNDDTDYDIISKGGITVGYRF